VEERDKGREIERDIDRENAKKRGRKTKKR